MEITPFAAELHKSAIIIDGHSDTMMERLSRGLDPSMIQRDESLHADVPRLLEGGFTAINSMCGNRDLHQSLALLEAIHRMVEEHGDITALAQSASDIKAAKTAGKLAFMPQLESCTLCAGSIATFRVLVRLGVRVANLTHGEGGGCQAQQSPFGYCEARDREAARSWPGLTDFGLEVVAECNRSGVVVDLAHTYDSAFFEAIEASAQPVIFSHGCVFAICPHWRGLTDDQLRALRDNGGVIGLAFYPAFIHKDAPSLDRLLDQFEYVIELIGPDHVGIGSDFDGIGDAVPIPGGVTRIIEITQGLRERGHHEATVRGALGGNFLRLYGEVMKG